MHYLDVYTGKDDPRQWECPVCYARGLPIPQYNLGEQVYKMACGTVVNLIDGNVIKSNCVKRPKSQTDIIYEMARRHIVMGEYKAIYAEDSFLTKHDPPKFVDQACDYVWWDTDLFLSVFNKDADFIGTVMDYSRSDNMLWANPVGFPIESDDLLQDDILAASSMWINTAPSAFTVGFLVVRGNSLDKAISMWYSYKWGTPIPQGLIANCLAVYSWINQPFVSLEDSIVHSRQVRRQAERENRNPPQVKTILLRRAESKHHETVELEPEDDRPHRTLSCCFERAGHTRRQWYPSIKSHKVIWIAPTLVGDTKKPFKHSGKKLYLANR